ncbi:hypothetical protein COOONC_10728 [Cooperia oncophora]
MRHPMVLNFINERLLDCAFFYTLHVLAFGIFLLLLSSHIFSSTLAKDIAVTAFIALFLFFMKRDNKWGVMRHPMVLNFINERLLDCAFFYTLHVLAFGIFLLLLSSHIFSSTLAKDIAVTAFIALFLFFMLLKGAIKARISHSISFWFVIAYAFNLATYLATFLYVWLPTFFSYDDYHEELKKVILWFLPIVAIISAWVNFLYILRKSPYGIYIFMMVRILRSFGHDDNATVLEKLFIILQAITKTSTMMIGEVDANDILDHYILLEVSDLAKD